MPNSIRDAAPDAWGRRIIINKLLGQKGKDAKEISEYIECIIRDYWDAVCEEAQLTKIDQKLLWGRQFLNPFSFEK